MNLGKTVSRFCFMLLICVLVLFVSFGICKVPVFDSVSIETHLMDVMWMAPFFSGGGYASESIEFVTKLAVATVVKAIQHGDSFRAEYYGMLPVETVNLLNIMTAENRVDSMNAITVCHSEPGAWHPSNWREQYPCPAEGSIYKVGRTMFETDRLPLGWHYKLNMMDEVWVPTEEQRKSII